MDGLLVQLRTLDRAGDALRHHRGSHVRGSDDDGELVPVMLPADVAAGIELQWVLLSRARVERAFRKQRRAILAELEELEELGVTSVPTPP